MLGAVAESRSEMTLLPTYNVAVHGGVSQVVEALSQRVWRGSQAIVAEDLVPELVHKLLDIQHGQVAAEWALAQERQDAKEELHFFRRETKGKTDDEEKRWVRPEEEIKILNKS